MKSVREASKSAGSRFAPFSVTIVTRLYKLVSVVGHEMVLIMKNTHLSVMLARCTTSVVKLVLKN